MEIDFEVNQYVILHTGDEWNGLCGLITALNKHFIEVFCVQFPGRRYFVHSGNIDVLEIIDF